MQDKATFVDFIKKSNEKQLEVAALSDIIGSNGAGSLLDVGGGNGEITCSLEDLFDSVTTIEKNQKFESNYCSSKARIHITSFEEYSTNQKFDFIIASHIFPYFDDDIREEMLNKLINLLKPSGKLLIVEMTKIGDIGHVKKLVLGEDFKSTYEHITSLFSKSHLHYDEIEIVPELVTNTPVEMYRFIRFFAEQYLDRFNDRKLLVKDYIEASLYDSEVKKYILSYTNKILIYKHQS